MLFSPTVNIITNDEGKRRIHPREIRHWIIPSTVNRIEGDIFKSNIERITIQPSSQPLVIETGAFYNCHNLRSFDFHSRPLIVKDYAFYYAGFVELIIPKTVRLDGKGIFMNNKQLLNLTIENGRRIIPNKSFECCERLINIRLPNDVVIIEKSAFQNCFELRDLICPDSLKRIGKNSFKNCGLRNFEAKNLQYIGKRAFIYCSFIKPKLDSIVKISKKAFHGTRVTNVMKTKTIYAIEEAAFDFDGEEDGLEDCHIAFVNSRR